MIEKLEEDFQMKDSGKSKGFIRVRRLHYLLISLVIMLIQFAAANRIGGLEPATLRTPLGWATVSGFIVAAFLRLKNIGGTPWIAPLVIIPYAQFYIWLHYCPVKSL